jgi:hypothetical protein
MQRRHPDFFRDLEHCIARSKPRIENLKALREQYDRVYRQTGSKARLEQAQLDQAIKVFESDTSYDEFWTELGSEDSGRSQAEFDEAQRRAEEARRQAQQAEAAKRREVQRSKELQRELEAERERREEAENQAQHAKPQSGWAALAKGFLEALAAPSESGNRVATPQPEAVADLTGVWRAPDGYTCRIWQNGNAVRIQLWDPWNRPVADSSGAFDGQFVRVSFTTVPMPTMWGLVPTHGVTNLQLVNGGYTLQGQSVNHVTGQALPVLLQRAS